MRIGPYKFDRLEMAGSLGDLGTLIPLAAALIALCGLAVTPVFLAIGVFYVATGLYYRLPIPVQPLKVVAAVAIASPDKITPEVIAASGIIFGVFLLALAFSGIVDKLAKFFTKPVVRGIQLGLGLILMTKGMDFICDTQLFMEHAASPSVQFSPFLNPAIGVIGFLVTLLLLGNKRFPGAMVIVFAGMLVGVASGALSGAELSPGPLRINLVMPGLNDFQDALWLLVLPQIPLTLGNAIIGTTDACHNLFRESEATKKVGNRSFAISMGVANIAAGATGAMPMCHGAGGLAAHYRFGARTGGSSIMIGVIFIIIALFLGKIGLSLLTAIPNAVFGILLTFAGLELALLTADVRDKNQLFVILLMAGVGLATTNMALAFICGMAVTKLMEMSKIRL